MTLSQVCRIAGSLLISFSFVLLAGCGLGAAPSGSSLILSSTTFDFGSVSVSSAASKSLTITNPGSAPVAITNLGVKGNFFSLSGIAAPTSLAPSQSVTAIIKFAPTAAGVISGSLAISTDTQGKDLVIPLNGTAVSSGVAQLSASPSPVDFGSVALGSSASKDVTLANVGSANAYVNSAGFSGPGFTISGLSTPLSLASGKSTTFTVTFAPSSTGTASGSVLFKDSSGANLLNLAMSGSGAAATAHSVDLTWKASTSVVAGYRVYRGLVSGGPYSLISSSLVLTTSFVDSTVVAGSSYFYVVTAVDLTNLESGYSNEVSAIVPTP